MNITSEKALKISSIFAVVSFLISFIVNWIEKNFLEGLLNGIVGGLILGGITFLISKSVIKNKIIFKWWQWIFYALGWITGFANLLFWIIMYIISRSTNFNGPFFNKDFHKRVYIWGIISAFLLTIGVISYLK